jgi:hypothetical protein
MSLVYILLEDGRQVAYEEAEVYDMLARQALSSETPFWRQGMAEWRPLAELPPPATGTFVPPRRVVPEIDFDYETPPEKSFEHPIRQTNQRREMPVAAIATRSVDVGAGPSSRRNSGKYLFRKDPVVLTVFLLIFQVASIVAATIFIYRCFNDISDAGNAGISPSELTSLFYFIGALLLLLAVTEILFYCWVHRANKNCRGFVSNMTYTSGWAVSSFFVPILNLFRPYQVMQQIWKVSDNTLGWIGRRNSIFVGIWFLFRLTPIILFKGPFHTHYNDSDDPNVQAIDTVIYMITIGANIVLMQLTTLILVSVITWRQVKLVRRVQ